MRLRIRPPRVPGKSRRTAAAVSAALTAGAALVAVVVTAPANAAAAGVPALSPLSVTGRGAIVPFTEFEAEYAATNGTVIGPTRYYGQLPSEASGRQAVTLGAVGQYVEFTLTKPANAMSVRYSIPDANGGQGVTAPIDLLVNGTKLKALNVTSNYSWFYGGYPFNNNPGDSNPHHFYDETRTLLGQTYPIGTKIRVQVSSTSVVPTFMIDLADFEVATQIAKPANVIDAVTDFGADPTGATDSTAKLQAAVNAGASQGKTVWVPAGNYTLYDHVVVDNVTVAGAGPWYTVFGGRSPSDRSRAAGFYGKYVSGGGYGGGIRSHEAGGPSRNVTLKDFAIIGDIRERFDNDQVNAIGGAMSNSVVDNVWMQHVKVGAWMDGPMDNFTIRNSRILDTTADGVNFHWGVTNSQVTNTFVRNTGDDGLAMWADTKQNANDSFTHNTVILPILANNIVTYGGRDIALSDNVMSDTITNGGGLHIANRYTNVNAGAGTAVSGTITAAGNTLIRTGNSDFNWQFGVGAIWFDALNGPLTGATINVSDSDILDSSYQALGFIEGQSSGINLTNLNIDGAGTFAIQAQAPSSVSFKNVVAKHISYSNPFYNCVGSSFQITDLGGNSGWNVNPPYCGGTWPTPVWTNGGVPSTTGPTAPASTAVPTTAAPTTATPTTSAPGCTVGTGNLAQGKQVTASSTTQTYVGANAVDGNAATYWESANNAFPQSLTVDLCAAAALSSVTLKLPTNWETRNQTLTVAGSTNGSTFTNLASGTYTFNQGSGNTVTIPVSGTARYVRVTITANSAWPAGQLSEFEVRGGGTTPTTSAPTTSAAPTTPSTVNVARGKITTAQSYADVYQPGRANDGDANSYWESANNAFPQWLQVDLGAATAVRRVVLKLPPATAWATRTETLSLQGSSDGSSFSTLVASAGYTFNPASGNTVTITVPSGSPRYLRLVVTGNTGWPAGQISELEAYTG
jgi:hypothetical protein